MQELPTVQAPPVSGLSEQEIAELSEETRALAAERNAVILAHNYQLPELQDLADFVGDSLGLSRAAASSDADVIAFCGVHFMAETASVLAPQKTVLIPDTDAGCSLSDSITADQLRAWKAEHPGALVVMYVNTSAEVKAETDYCCTSSNAVQVVEHIWSEHGPEQEILFGPDMWLGAFVERETGLHEDPDRRSRFHIWDGECHVHAGIRPDDINEMRASHPGAEFLIHPECGCSTQAMEYVAAGDVDAEGVHMLSTSGMLKQVEANPTGEFIVATETGMLYPLQEAAPEADLIAANRMAFCKYMKMITLPKLRDCLRDMEPVVKVPPAIAERAKVPIERMVAIGEAPDPRPAAPPRGRFPGVTAVSELELPSLDYTDEALRGEHFHEVINGLASESWLASSPMGWLFVLDREAATFFLRSRAMHFPAVTASEALGVTEGPMAEAIRKNIISIEGDDHRRLRNIVNPAFSLKEADRRRPAMREHIEELWEQVAADGSCDFVEAIAERYPALMIATVVGAPLADADRLHDWALWFQRKFDPVAVLEQRPQIEEKITELGAYVRELIESRRSDPGDDLISILLTASHEGDRLSEDECLHLVMNVFAGGIDTTRGQLAHGIRLFAGHPEQWELLGREPERAPVAVEEILRFEPVTPFAARMTTEELTYRDATIPAGTVIMISTFAANRDPEAVAEPLEFDITADRGKAKPMTFGAGIHNCLGANLARAELQEALAYLAPRMRDLELDGEPRYESIAAVYGLESLPIRYRAPG